MRGITLDYGIKVNLYRLGLLGLPDIGAPRELNTACISRATHSRPSAGIPRATHRRPTACKPRATHSRYKSMLCSRSKRDWSAMFTYLVLHRRLRLLHSTLRTINSEGPHTAVLSWGLRRLFSSSIMQKHALDQSSIVSRPIYQLPQYDVSTLVGLQ